MSIYNCEVLVFGGFLSTFRAAIHNYKTTNKFGGTEECLFAHSYVG